MNICPVCNKETVNPKFCSRSCSASYNGKLFPKRKKEGSCNICNKPINASRAYCSDECRGKARSISRKLSTKTSYDSVKTHRRKLKEKAIAYKGGCCSICGYKKSKNALEFHHVNPSEKDFSISGMYHLGWEKIQTELDKCILVCANCHAEIHEVK